MLLPELLQKVDELSMICEDTLSVDSFTAAMVEAQMMSGRLTGRRHKAEINDRLMTIERRQARWIKHLLLDSIR